MQRASTSALQRPQSPTADSQYTSADHCSNSRASCIAYPLPHRQDDFPPTSAELLTNHGSSCCGDNVAPKENRPRDLLPHYIFLPRMIWACQLPGRRRMTKATSGPQRRASHRAVAPTPDARRTYDIRGELPFQSRRNAWDGAHRLLPPDREPRRPAGKTATFIIGRHR